MPEYSEESVRFREPNMVHQQLFWSDHKLGLIYFCCSRLIVIRHPLGSPDAVKGALVSGNKQGFPRR